MEDTVRANFTCPGLAKLCKDLTSDCKICSKMKLTNIVKDGQLPIKEDKLVKPQELLPVDLCGPWKIKCELEEEQKTITVSIQALTVIDEGSVWPEITAIDNKYSEEIAKLVDDCWLNRYPRPLYCLHDNGGEFIGKGFEEMLASYGVQSQPTIVKNPQANGAHERMHLLLCEMLRSQKLVVPQHSTPDKEINRVLQSAA